MKELTVLYHTLKDLHTFSEQDLNSLANYYHIDQHSENKNWLIAEKILDNYQYAPIPGDLTGTTVVLPDPDSDNDIPFQVIERVGRGAQGSAYTIMSKDNREYVLKVTPITFINELKIFQRIMAEKLVPKYVVRIYSFMIGDDGKLYLILEKLDGVNLESIITDLTIKDTKLLANQAIAGLNYLHDKEIFHRDIKPDNMIWNPTTKRLKFIDFGAACGVGIDCPPVQGAPKYTAPNLMTMIDQDDESPESQKGLDVYALGIILYQLANKVREPFNDEIVSLGELINFILNKEQLVSNSGDQKLDQLINRMIANDPEERITAKQALELVQDL